jgi:hypothetical protein
MIWALVDFALNNRIDDIAFRFMADEEALAVVIRVEHSAEKCSTRHSGRLWAPRAACSVAILAHQSIRRT